MDPGASPARRLRHLEHQLPDLRRSMRATRALLRILLVLGCTKPFLECAMLHIGDELSQLVAHSFAESDQSPPLLRGQRHPFGELGSEDLVLDGELLDLGNELIVIRPAQGQHFRQTCGILTLSKARIGFLHPWERCFLEKSRLRTRDCLPYL